MKPKEHSTNYMLDYNAARFNAVQDLATIQFYEGEMLDRLDFSIILFLPDSIYFPLLKICTVIASTFGRWAMVEGEYNHKNN